MARKKAIPVNAPRRSPTAPQASTSKQAEALPEPDVTLDRLAEQEVAYRIQKILALPEDWIVVHCAILQNNATASLRAHHNLKHDPRRRALNAVSYHKEIRIARALHAELEARGIPHVWRGS